MTPEDRAEIFAPPAPRQPRRQRLAGHRNGSSAAPGGISQPCGCRYTRTGGKWLHITPCRSHALQDYPITDEHIMEVLAA